MKEQNNQSVSDAESRNLESLSALMDGEANDLDLARVLKAGDESDALRAYWTRQHQIREIMHSGSATYSTLDVSEGVRDAISGEKRRYANPLVSMAVAASVTVAVVLGGQQALLFNETPVPTITAPGAIVQLPGTGAVQASFAQPVSPLSQPQLATRADNSVDRRTGTAATRAFYNELAEERALSLGPVHQSAAASASISPFIARVTEPNLDK